ncbi:MAG: hypothetical protein HY606_11415 [Planctomycetes bacterium]|nr:hypothetical protein [Planctomycetota bacterium]
MMVTMIMGVIAFTFSGGLDRFVPFYKLRQAQREVASSIGLAQTRAKSSNDYFFVQIDFPSRQYWVLSPFKNESAQIEYRKTFESKLPSEVSFVNVIKSKEQVETNGRVTIIIDPYGRVQPLIINLRLETNNTTHSTKIGGIGSSIQFQNKEGKPDDLFKEEFPEEQQ